ncbi:MAG: pyridoxal-phosphate dependent enzyme, partial [Rhodothermales bacterium]|nr:pyridoxal-phosphate dependent enzyme [Rhodothermales bacterium]
ADVFFKCENLQRTGSFKFRGAYNALSMLADSEKRSGVLTYSSGNHAQAIALAGRVLGIGTTIIMPENAPAVKKEATRNYGATIITYDPGEIKREVYAEMVSIEKNLPIVPPYDHPGVIAGQGTVADELHEDVPDLDVLLVCCGGGGLLSGCAIATKHLRKECLVVGVEPLLADDAARSFSSGKLQTVDNPPTIADGARTPSLGKYTFPIVLEHVDAMDTVTEQEIVDAMHMIIQRLKLVVEPTGALATAGLFSPKIDIRRKRVGVVISGGNVDLHRIADPIGTA